MIDDYKDRNNVLALWEYNLMIGIFLLWGAIFNIIILQYCSPIFMEFKPYLVIITYVVVATIGILMSLRSSNPIIRFIGYNLVVLPIGMVLSIICADSDKFSITNIINIITSIIILMTSTFICRPDTFNYTGSVLSVMLTFSVIVEIIFIFVMETTYWDIFISFIISIYIGYNWSNSQTMPRNINNALDSVVSLYLNIINLFSRFFSTNNN